ncbi:MAG: hypothetical protein ACOC3V_05300 [bacterium]
MKFQKILKEASAEVYGQGTNERFIVNLGNRTIEPADLRSLAPNSYKVIMKAISYAKSKLGLDLSANKLPADVNIKSDGSVIITDDKSQQSKRVDPIQLGLKPEVINALKKELASQ